MTSNGKVTNSMFMNLQQTDELSLHIRVVGHWTSKLYEYFEAEQKRLEFTMNGETPEASQTNR